MVKKFCGKIFPLQISHLGLLWCLVASCMLVYYTRAIYRISDYTAKYDMNILWVSAVQQMASEMWVNFTVPGQWSP